MVHSISLERCIIATRLATAEAHIVFANNLTLPAAHYKVSVIASWSSYADVRVVLLKYRKLVAQSCYFLLNLFLLPLGCARWEHFVASRCQRLIATCPTLHLHLQR